MHRGKSGLVAAGENALEGDAKVEAEIGLHVDVRLVAAGVGNGGSRQTAIAGIRVGRAWRHSGNQASGIVAVTRNGTGLDGNGNAAAMAVSGHFGHGERVVFFSQN